MSEIECRVIRVDSSVIDSSKVLCPFCNADNRDTHCKHLEKVEEPVYQNSLTGKLLGNYSYWFIKR